MNKGLTSFPELLKHSVPCWRRGVCEGERAAMEMGGNSESPCVVGERNSREGMVFMQSFLKG